MTLIDEQRAAFDAWRVTLPRLSFANSPTPYELLGTAFAAGWLAHAAASPRPVLDREGVARIVWHAMTSMAGSRLTLEEARAATPSVEGNCNLLYLENAAYAILALIPPHTGGWEGIDHAKALAEALEQIDDHAGAIVLHGDIGPTGGLVEWRKWAVSRAKAIGALSGKALAAYRASIPTPPAGEPAS